MKEVLWLKLASIFRIGVIRSLPDRPHNHAQTLATLTIQIEKIDKEIKAYIVQHEELLAEVHIMTAMPGVIRFPS